MNSGSNINMEEFTWWRQICTYNCKLNYPASAGFFSIYPSIWLPVSGAHRLNIQSPSDGGIATGYHTLNVVSNSENGYVVNMSVAPNGTDLKSSDIKNTDTIPSTTATLSDPAALPDNTWGIALPGNSTYSNFNSLNSYTSTSSSTLDSTKYSAVPTANTNIMITIAVITLLLTSLARTLILPTKSLLISTRTGQWTMAKNALI